MERSATGRSRLRRWLLPAILVLPASVDSRVDPDGRGASRLDWGAYQQVEFVTADGLSGTFRVRVADTKEKRALGLMFNPRLPLNEGMLFVFDSEQHIAMYMRNTLIPLDMWFLRRNGEVSKVHHSATQLDPRHIHSESPAIGVLEINAGLSRLLGVTPGTVVRHPTLSR
ncbi:MAG: DUF192 domain-containing protein [Pseudomonadales bacterium]|nr:DUF192 domain-containing protein [Pseudomonadales bacterium]